VFTRLGSKLFVSTGLLLLTCASCSAPSASHRSLPATTQHRSIVFGPRKFTVTGISLAYGTWLTIGLHPTTEPIRLQATTAVPLEVCPAGLDGEIAGNTSWPASFGFLSCMALAGSGVAMLPATDGTTHVAFAIRLVAMVGEAPLTLQLSYSATDSFVEIIPPVAGVRTDMTVTITPRSGTTGAQTNLVGQLRSAPGYSVAVRQSGRHVTKPSPCDFGSEVPCVGPVTPSEPVRVHLTGPGMPSVVLSLAWN
jgi:hypothetical protein